MNHPLDFQNPGRGQAGGEEDIRRRASQETGPSVRCTNRVPRGTKENPDVCTHTPRLAPILFCIPADGCRPFACLCCGGAWPGHRSAGRAGCGRATCTDSWRQNCRQRTQRNGRELLTAYRPVRPFLRCDRQQYLPPDVDARLLCRSPELASAERGDGAGTYQSAGRGNRYRHTDATSAGERRYHCSTAAGLS
jgi:hypothetical protein